MEGITLEVLAAALAAARGARRHILAEMRRCSPAPRGALAPNAPRIRRFSVAADKLGLLIGPGGRNIRALIEESGASDIKVLPVPAALCRPVCMFAWDCLLTLCGLRLEASVFGGWHV